MHWDKKIDMPQMHVSDPTVLREILQLYMGTMLEDRMVGGVCNPPRRRTPLSLHAM
jgi:hypothetical protein